METKSRLNVTYILAALLIVAGLITAIVGENDPAGVPVIYSPDGSVPSTAFSVELDFALKDLDENEVTITQFEDQVRVVNFWATWCGPCVEEIPDFQVFHENYDAEGVKVIGIALDKEGAEIVKPFVAEMDMTYLTLIDTEGTSAAKFGGVYGIPTTFIIDRDGTVRKKHIGMMSYENLETAVLPLLAQ